MMPNVGVQNFPPVQIATRCFGPLGQHAERSLGAGKTWRCGVFSASLLLVCLIAVQGSVWGQAMSVEQLLEQRDQWDQWSKDGTKLQLTGRYQGRAAQIFQLSRIPFSFEPPRNSPLPDRMREGQRIEVSGRLSTRSGRMTFDINRLSVGGTDVDIIKERQQSLAADDYQGMFALADEFQAFANFYSDNSLRLEIVALREAAIQKQRRQLKGQPVELWQLADKAASLNLNNRLPPAIRFEAIITEWKQPGANADKVLKQIEQHTAGWDTKNLMASEKAVSDFQAGPIDAYNNASDADRLALHRYLYRVIVLQSLQRQLNASGSNGVEIAAMVRERLPEETDAIRMMEQRDLEYRIGRVQTLSRTELEQLSDLLVAASRPDDVSSVVDSWIAAQQARYAASGLAGQLRTADEFLFVGTRWKRLEYTQKGVELLKQAWAIARQESASDAEGIAERLKTLGWERLKDQWMTSSQIQSLPRDDVQLAMREGRVVKGMTAEHVVGTLGQPARISRIISARIIRELWIYEAQGTSGVIVQFQRNRRDAIKDARVTEVSSTSSAR